MKKRPKTQNDTWLLLPIMIGQIALRAKRNFVASEGGVYAAPEQSLKRELVVVLQICRTYGAGRVVAQVCTCFSSRRP